MTSQDLLAWYGCGPIKFSGHSNAVYQRHPLFEDIIGPKAANDREKSQGATRSARGVLLQHWARTGHTYAKRTPRWHKGITTCTLRIFHPVWTPNESCATST